MVQYDDFAETFGKSRENMHWEEIDTLLEYFVSHFSEEKQWSSLDIGCGNGRLLRHILMGNMKDIFVEHDYLYTGLDASKGLISQAQDDAQINTSFSPRWLVGDMREIDDIFTQKKQFDVCFFIASFHHLENYDERLQVLKYVKNISKPGGIIAMTNWNLTSESQKKYRTSRVVDYPDGSADFMIKIGEYRRFYHAFSSTEYEKLSRDSGLRIDMSQFGERNSVIIFSQ